MNLRINLPILGLLIHASASAAVLPWYGFYGGTARDMGLIIFGYIYSSQIRILGNTSVRYQVRVLWRFQTHSPLVRVRQTYSS